jgi:DNA-binding MarR family transcriptional regulator
VSLCAAGQDKLAACTGDVNAARVQLFDGLGQEEIAGFLDVLKRMQRNSAGLRRGRKRA